MISPNRVYSEEELAPLSREVVEIQYLNPEKGYGLIATKPIARGDAIITKESPLVATLNPGPSDRCAWCWKRLLEFDFRCDCGLHYCSVECQFRHYPAHAFLCTAQVANEQHPLIKFKLHAIKTNPMFLTSAWGIAQVLANPMEMSAKLANFQLMPWEEAVPAPLREELEPEHEHAQAGNEEEEPFAKILSDLAFQAQTQLEEALISLEGAQPAAIRATCGMYFSPLLGALERNQFEIEIEPEQGDREESEEEQFPCGAGIFTLCCVLNHSCLPNAEIRFESGTNQATVRALRDIAAGEEMCISYVDENESLAERQEQLRDYGFVCTCARCTQEQAWMEEQVRLAKLVVCETDTGEEEFTPKLVAGFDISFPEDQTHNASVACLCVMKYPEMKLVYEKVEDCTMTHPYIPGFLAFREAGVCQAMLNAVPKEFKPDVLVLDGSGVMHPRQCGLASHVGVVCNIPTIGVSKNLLAVDGLTRDSCKEQVQKMLKQGKKRELALVGRSGRVWGRAFVPPKAKANPVFVSVGHRMDLDTAMRIVHACCKDSRVPAPVRHADLRSREELRSRKN